MDKPSAGRRGWDVGGLSSWESWSQTHGSQGGARHLLVRVSHLWGGAGRPGRRLVTWAGLHEAGLAAEPVRWAAAPGRGGRSSSRRWKARPRPQLRLQLLQPDQDDRPQSTAGTDRWAWFREGLTREQEARPPREHPDLTGTSLAPYHSHSHPSCPGSPAAGYLAALGGQTLPLLPQVSWLGEQRPLEGGNSGRAVVGTVKGMVPDARGVGEGGKGHR